MSNGKPHVWWMSFINERNNTPQLGMDLVYVERKTLVEIIKNPGYLRIEQLKTTPAATKDDARVKD